MTDRCVCCGDEVPEGRQVCPMCESVIDASDAHLKDGTPLFLKTRSTIRPAKDNLQLFLYQLLKGDR